MTHGVTDLNRLNLERDALARVLEGADVYSSGA